MNEINQRITEAAHTLLNNYPLVREEVERRTENYCFSCNDGIDRFFSSPDVFLKEIKVSVRRESPIITRAEISWPWDDYGCCDGNWVQFSACLVVCTATAYLYPVCAALCVDTYCSC